MPEQGRPQQLKGVAVDIIGVIIAGIIIGLLGKFFAPGNRDNIPLWLTMSAGSAACSSATTSPQRSVLRRRPASTGSGGSSALSSRPSWS